MRLGQQVRQEMTQQRKLKTHSKARKNIRYLLQYQRLLLLENAHVLQFSLPKSLEAHQPDFFQLKLSVLVQVLTFAATVMFFSSDGFVRDRSTELQQQCLKRNELHTQKLSQFRTTGPVSYPIYQSKSRRDFFTKDEK